MSDLTERQESSTSSNAQKLSIPFTSRSKAGEINVKIEPNRDPEHAAGLDLIFPHISQSSFAAQFHGFPVIRATIEYPIPPSPFSSYSSLFGWIQFVKCVPTHPISEESAKWGTGEWEIDIFPYAMDLKSPFCYWGYNPTAFDAPARLLKDDRKVEDLVWRAQSFLCVLEDAGMTKRVRLIEGAGYGWGFDNESVESSGETDVQRKIIIKGLEILDVDKEWGERLTLLRELYPEWTFRAAGEN